MAARHLCEPWPDWGHFVTALETLCDEYDGVINVSAMGFPPQWDRLLRRYCRRHRQRDPTPDMHCSIVVTVLADLSEISRHHLAYRTFSFYRIKATRC